MRSEKVAIRGGCAEYDAAAPFSPGCAYPEYPFSGTEACSPGGNNVYDAVRESLRLLGLDEARFGTPEWNPLGGLIKPGDTVVLKPNLVREFHESDRRHDGVLTTHGSIIRAAADYAFIALKGEGRIVIADAPQDDADFAALRRLAGIDAIAAFYREHAGFEIEVYDLRRQRDLKVDGLIVGQEPLAGDPAGYVTVDLGEHSAFREIEDRCHLLYGSGYDTDEIRRHHRDGVHEYDVSRTVLEADCVIELPKLKTHKKVGFTANMKLLVGINGRKNWVAHYRVGVPGGGGDAFASSGLLQRVEHGVVGTFKRAFPYLGPLRRMIARPLRRAGEAAFGTTDRVVRSGNWHGNDTAWRMAHDLMRVLLHADRDGRLADRPARRVFSIVDAVIAGEGDGPLEPRPKLAGMILAGSSPAAVDFVCCRLMGFDYHRVAMLGRATDAHDLPLLRGAPEDIVCRSNLEAYDRPLGDFQGLCLAFAPHFGWLGHVELGARDGVDRRPAKNASAAAETGVPRS